MLTWKVDILSAVKTRFGTRPLLLRAKPWGGALTIRQKLPLLIAALTLACVAALMLASARLTQASQTEFAEQQIMATTQERATQLTQWLANTNGALLTMASGKQTVDALYTLSSAFKDLKDQAKTVLQAAYIDSNPNPSGARHLLDRADGSAFYHAEHGKFHKTFRSMMEQNAFYDVFLINRDGDVVYSVFKESDFADSLKGEALAQTGLASVYTAAMAAQAGEIVISSFAPYGPSGGAFALFLGTPVVSEMGVVVGVLAIQMPIDHIAGIVQSDAVVGQSTQTYLVDENGMSLSAARDAQLFVAGANIGNLPHVTFNAEDEIALHRDALLQSSGKGIAATVNIPVLGKNWLLVTERDYADIMTEVYALLLTQLLIGAISIVVVTAASFWVSKSISAPITQLNMSIQQVASGQYDLQVPNTHRRDEIGTMASSIDDMRKALAAAQKVEEARALLQKEQSHVVERLTSGLGDLAAGDLSKTIDEDFPPAYEVLRGYFNQTVEKMGESIEMIASATEGIRAQSSEITRASEDLAHRTEVQAATLEQTAAAMDEMTASVKSAADGVHEVETIVGEARKQADQSDTIVKEAVSAMAEIEKSSSQISQIIAVIDDIAFQTNLLALNAGVEAARAGDAGRGFAVVASEVGALAQRASTAAKEIKTLISTSAHHVELGVERVKQAGSALQKIAQRVTHISTLTSSMATGASEQSIGLHEINVGVTQLDQATQKNAAMAEEANAASQLMAAGMQELGRLVARFKLREGAALAVQDTSHISSTPDIDLSAFHQEDPQPIIDLAPMQPDPKIAVNARGVWQDF
jgi:methyl-accepting chemotaxis protein